MMPTRRDLFPAIHALILISLIGANMVAALSVPVLCWLTIPLAALAMAGALSVAHEAAHATYFGGRWPNRIVGRVFASIILINFSLYRRDHMRHHAYIGTPRDTERPKRIDTLGRLVCALLLNDHAWTNVSRSFRTMVQSGRPAAIKRDAWGLALLLGFAGTATSLWPVHALIGFWLPFVISLVLDNAISLPEHALVGCPSQPITRSIRTAACLQYMLYYVNLHVEHHGNPSLSATNWRRHQHKRAPSSSYSYFYKTAFQGAFANYSVIFARK